jgi:hypothetical protein
MPPPRLLTLTSRSPSIPAPSCPPGFTSPRSGRSGLAAGYPDFRTFSAGVFVKMALFAASTRPPVTCGGTWDALGVSSRPPSGRTGMRARMCPNNAWGTSTMFLPSVLTVSRSPLLLRYPSATAWHRCRPHSCTWPREGARFARSPDAAKVSTRHPRRSASRRSPGSGFTATGSPTSLSSVTSPTSSV